MPHTELTILAESPAEIAFTQGLQACDTLLIEPLTASRLCTFEVLVRSPGSALSRAPAGSLRGRRALTTPSSLWFAAHRDARTICVTGTKGKSTTAALLAHLLRLGGHKSLWPVTLDLPLLACDDQGVDWWVIELSSYQISDLEAAPTIAVILNLSPEHLDWHGSEEVYFRDKLRLATLAAERTGHCRISLMQRWQRILPMHRALPGLTQ